MPEKHILELFDPSLYIQNFELKGADHTVTIDRVVGGEIIGEDGKKAKKPVVYFSDWPKPLVLGKRTAKTIWTMYGADPSGWIGKRITIYPTREMGFGEMQDVVRVRKVKPPPKAAAAPAKSPQERAEAVRTALSGAGTLDALQKAWRLSDGFRTELDASGDLTTLDSLTIAYEQRQTELKEGK